MTPPLRRPVTLHLVRHADALDGDGSGDDALRTLSPKGVEQAALLGRALRARGVAPTLVYASPRRRALQTAQGLLGGAADPVALRALGAGDAAETVRALRSALMASPNAGDAQSVAVGHQPWLSELAAYLLTGRTDGVGVAFGKGTIATLEGALSGGGMTLVALTPMRLTRALLDGDAA